jgi:hypothetical protein
MVEKALAKSSTENEITSLDSLPETVEVFVIDDSTGGTTSLGHLNTVTGEFVTDDRWYDLNGRKLQGKPTTKGTYYNNRKKVIIK